MKHLDKVIYGATAYGIGYGAGSKSLAFGLIGFAMWLVFGMIVENAIERLKKS